MKKSKVGIVGAAGYTGGELIRLLIHHPNVDLNYISSRSQTGKKVYEVHEDLVGQSDLTFTADYPTDLDILFLCLPHGHSKEFLAKTPIPTTTKIIDLSNDFRLKGDADDFVYGLPELNKLAIKSANKIANPGCFATAIQLALLPLANSEKLQDDIHISAVTGSTGAGVNPMATTHFTWRNNNMSVYKAFEHQHLGEIGESLHQLQPSFENSVHFIPYRGNFTRGIIATCYTKFDGDLAKATALYDTFYKKAAFVHRSETNIHLKQVVNTNNNILYLEKHGDQLMIVSIIDNLLKGASGQAVQNMNLVMGWDERTGLNLKAASF